MVEELCVAGNRAVGRLLRRALIANEPSLTVGLLPRISRHAKPQRKSNGGFSWWRSCWRQSLLVRPDPRASGRGRGSRLVRLAIYLPLLRAPLTPEWSGGVRDLQSGSLLFLLV